MQKICVTKLSTAVNVKLTRQKGNGNCNGSDWHIVRVWLQRITILINTVNQTTQQIDMHFPVCADRVSVA